MAKKKKAKPEVQDVELKDLETAVDEVNEQLDLDPVIEKTSDKHMRQELKEAMEDADGELFEGNEEFTSGTYKVFEVLGIEHDAVKIKDESVKKGENEKMKTKTKATKKKAEGLKVGKKKTVDYSKSNKAVIYKAWKKGKGIKDPEKLLKLVNNKVALTTVRGWLGMWKNGKGLPAIANGK